MPVNYQEGKIYKVHNTINDDIYVGSTTLKLCVRIRDHRSGSYHPSKKHLPIYNAFREHGFHNFYIELIEKCPCNGVDELKKKEGEYIRTMKPTLNVRVAGRSGKDSRKIYRENNKELLAQKKLEKLICEYGCLVTRAGLRRHQRTKKQNDLLNSIN